MYCTVIYFSTFNLYLFLFSLQTDAITLEHVQKQLDHCITEHRYLWHLLWKNVYQIYHLLSFWLIKYDLFWIKFDEGWRCVLLKLGSVDAVLDVTRLIPDVMVELLWLKISHIMDSWSNFIVVTPTRLISLIRRNPR